MDPDLFISIFPRLYHMAEAGSWESIARHGLMSTSALLDAEGIWGTKREAIESQRRATPVLLPKSNRIVRDQGPMSDTLVAKSLQGSTFAPSDWYRLLNSLVFFFVREEQLHKLMCAKNYRDKEHDVLTVDTASLVDAHYGRVRLCPINSGATFGNPQPRGPETFKPIADYPFDEITRRRRSPKKAVAECCVVGEVPDIAKHTLTVFRMRHGKSICQIF